MADKKSKDLKFSMEEQKEMAWCWSAVGTSSALFYNSKSGWTQCKVANKSIQPAPGNCCKDSKTSACNCTWYLDNAQHLGSFQTTGIHNGYQEGAISFDKLRSEIDSGRVVAFRMEMDSMYHFVVISGYDTSSDENFVTVNDPFFGGVEIPYGEFKSKYRGDGSVTHTFFSKPAS